MSAINFVARSSRITAVHVRVETFHGYESFDSYELQECLEEFDDLLQADNLPKWLCTAIMYQQNLKDFSPTVRKQAKRIIQSMLDGKIKELEFLRDTNGNIKGLKMNNINVSSFLARAASITAATRNFQFHVNDFDRKIIRKLVSPVNQKKLLLRFCKKLKITASISEKTVKSFHTLFGIDKPVISPTKPNFQTSEWTVVGDGVKTFVYTNSSFKGLLQKVEDAAQGDPSIHWAIVKPNSSFVVEIGGFLYFATNTEEGVSVNAISKRVKGGDDFKQDTFLDEKEQPVVEFLNSLGLSSQELKYQLKTVEDPMTKKSRPAMAYAFSKGNPGTFKKLQAAFDKMYGSNTKTFEDRGYKSVAYLENGKTRVLVSNPKSSSDSLIMLYVFK